VFAISGLRNASKLPLELGLYRVFYGHLALYTVAGNIFFASIYLS